MTEGTEALPPRPVPAVVRFPCLAEAASLSGLVAWSATGQGAGAAMAAAPTAAFACAMALVPAVAARTVPSLPLAALAIAAWLGLAASLAAAVADPHGVLPLASAFAVALPVAGVGLVARCLSATAATRAAGGLRAGGVGSTGTEEPGP